MHSARHKAHACVDTDGVVTGGGVVVTSICSGHLQLFVDDVIQLVQQLTQPDRLLYPRLHSTSISTARLTHISTGKILDPISN